MVFDVPTTSGVEVNYAQHKSLDENSQYKWLQQCLQDWPKMAARVVECEYKGKLDEARLIKSLRKSVSEYYNALHSCPLLLVPLLPLAIY